MTLNLINEIDPLKEILYLINLLNEIDSLKEIIDFMFINVFVQY